ncbi:MAG: metalloregulator ArsR/SmtB family transcription factor [Acidobacteriota bacterium]|nr:metalloregulator ArsR/SmtB family transcription factor [Acidobacteriota bacterium]
MPRSPDLARIFKALSDPNRLAIFQLLRKRCGPGCRVAADDAGNTVSDIADEFDIALSTVSHHLKELKNAGLISCEKRGLWVYCAPNHAILETIKKFART